MITILADENITHLDDYFCHDNIKLIKLKGREISQSVIDNHNPTALLIRSVTPINSNTITNPKNIKFIGSATIGTDHVDNEFIHSNNIRFANAKGSSKHSVAQYVITAILSKFSNFLHKKITIGIIGLGNIGGTLAQYAKELGWQILGYDPYLPTSDTNNSSFDELLKNSDIISIHTPLTKTGSHPTHQLFNQSIFKQLKNHAILINTARGEIIHQDDLLWAINNKNISVILDVFPFEPMIDKILLDKLTIATPHIAGYTLDGKLRGTDMVYQAFCEYFNLPILQSMNDLMPTNNYHWQILKNELLNGDTHHLKIYYDILKDDNHLRKICADKVHGADFDELRKKYELKREWLYD
ncbi:4-phosphoerythronate dehydrogenase [Moraxella nonliquefaciens]|uniref:4-phosphoerythronate dehydrogenase n=1 Tax=Moraxella nonliquefaciens TaxID=478 RepID=UPI0024A69D2F|nr:4-phosphoerythronate dehydrogenase [Moraxella nonliquefaciens]MDI4498647.1 4-phosphoerythronate dehydrogenase [Moraxella nonliquefaciens]MDI4500405.1 4-phosphoerythronate dehydrogenase [Moraxella nonliquefaciens]